MTPSDKFTQRGRKVLDLAQEEARSFNHNYIGTEHLLLGLIREGDGVAARILAMMGVQLPMVRRGVEFIIGRGEGNVTGDLGYTPRAKKVIELAVDEARLLNHHYIGTEHLLLGLIREGDGIGAGVLESLGVNLRQARIHVYRSIDARLEVTMRDYQNLIDILTKMPDYDVLKALRSRHNLKAALEENTYHFPRLWLLVEKRPYLLEMAEVILRTKAIVLKEINPEFRLEEEVIFPPVELPPHDAPTSTTSTRRSRRPKPPENEEEKPDS